MGNRSQAKVQSKELHRPVLRILQLLGIVVFGTMLQRLSGPLVRSSFYLSSRREETIKGSALEASDNVLEASTQDKPRSLGEAVESCRCRKERHLYHRQRKKSPAQHLTDTLTRYTSMHQRCVQTAGDLYKHLKKEANDADCKFLVVPESTEGLGNKLMSLVSAFTYALLTWRVLLVPRGAVPAQLLCEPFSGSSWLLPESFGNGTVHGEMQQWVTMASFAASLKRGDIGVAESVPHAIVGDLSHAFHEDWTQQAVANVSWLFMPANVYYVPQLYLVPSFRPMLTSLFPDRAVFTHLGRHIIVPRDKIWARILALYRAYFAFGDRQVAVQARYLVYETLPDGQKHLFNHGDHIPLVNERLTACLLNTSQLLPRPVNSHKDHPALSTKARSLPSPIVSVFVASQYAEAHASHLKTVYKDAVTASGEIVSIQHVSAQHVQKMEIEHHAQALVEMWLLSFADALITSANSTFSFVAQGLGNLRPWVLNFQQSGGWHDCFYRASQEPCHLDAPVYMEHNNPKSTDTAAVLPFLKRCPDRVNSLQLLVD